MEICKSDDPGEFYQNVCQQILLCADDAIPKTNPNPPSNNTLLYWNDKIKIAVKDKNMAYKNWLKNRTVANLSSYKEKKSNAQKIIREEAKQSWQRFCDKLNGTGKDKVVWRMAAKMAGKKLQLKR